MGVFCLLALLVISGMSHGKQLQAAVAVVFAVCAVESMVAYLTTITI